MSETTVRNWRGRDTLQGHPHTPRRLTTTLNPLQEFRGGGIVQAPVVATGRLTGGGPRGRMSRPVALGAGPMPAPPCNCTTILAGISHLTDAQRALLGALHIEVPTEARLTATM